MRRYRHVHAVASDHDVAFAGVDDELLLLVEGNLNVDCGDAGVAGDDDGAAGIAADGVRPAGIERTGLAFQTPGEEEQPRLAEQGLDEADHEADAGPQDHKPDGAAPGERFGAESYAADRGNESFVGSTADEAAEQAAEDSVANLHRHLVGDA